MATSDVQRLPVSEAQGSGIPERRPRARSNRGWLGRWKNASLLWRVFVANIGLLVAAVAILAWAPVTVHRTATPRELVILAVGLVLVLAVDLVLLRRVLAPLRRLAALMGAVEPDQPGRRAEPPASGGQEVVALAEALNAMLDRLEDERRDSGRRALLAQESERARIARELHDEVGQTLTAVALRAEQAAGAPSRQNEALSEIAETVLRSLEDVQRIGRELRPEALDDLGLINALIVMCSRLARQSGVRIQRQLDAQLPPLSEEVELVVYRVAQEALTNALRHSGANEVSVSLHSTGDRVTLIVADNGRGFSPGRRTGGLRGMRERAMLTGSDLDISSTVGQGSAIRLAVPIEPEAA